MEVLEQKVPAGKGVTGSERSYAEKQLLGSFMTTSPSEAYNCGNCTGCQLGSCFNCAHYTN